MPLTIEVKDGFCNRWASSYREIYIKFFYLKKKSHSQLQVVFRRPKNVKPLAVFFVLILEVVYSFNN